jgi:DNA-binding response OmpR family regulator
MRPIEVLFVEDNSGDTLLVYEALEESPIPHKFHLARDGEQALLMLRDRTFDPDLILLDLSLPKLSGFDVLEQCRPTGVPVVVFSGSLNEADRRRVLELGACEFIQKPAGFNAYKETVRHVFHKWGRRKQDDT